MADPLDDPDVAAALRIIGRRTNSGRHLCIRCGRRWIVEADELCDECVVETRATANASKRRWWSRRGAVGATAQRRAATWLASELRAGPVRSAVLKRRAADDGIAIATLQRARVDLGVEHRRIGGGREPATWWALPKDVARLNRLGSETSNARPPHTTDEEA